MDADPDWEEIAARTAQILAANATSNFCHTPWSILLVSYQTVLDAEVEQLARMEMLMHRTWPAPGLADGVRRGTERVGHLIEIRRRCITTFAPS